MKAAVFGWISIALLSVTTGSGCHYIFRGTYRVYDACVHSSSSCGDCEVCDPCNGCNGCDGCNSARRYSDEWWAMEASRPVGARQKCKKGKLWPPFARPDGPKQQFCHRYHAAHYWPYPHICDDRQYVRNFSELQCSNGWMEGTTLFDYHFEEDELTLNHSGENHLRWILVHAPVHRRAVWVQASFNREISDDRLAAVQDRVAELVGEGEIPPVMLRITSAAGRPAEEIDLIRRAELNSTPEPRIVYQALTGGEAE